MKFTSNNWKKDPSFHKTLFTKQIYKSQNRVTSSKLLMINRDLRQKLDKSTDKKFTACQTQTMTEKLLKLQTSEGI